MRRVPTFALIWLIWLGAAVPVFASIAEVDSMGMDWSKVPEYRFVPGDRIALNTGPRPDAQMDNIREMRIRPDGRITVHPIGDVIAAGRTPAELERAVTALLSESFRSPRVTVELLEAAGNQVHVLGRVEKPGSYLATPFMTVMQAIATAGGLTDDASQNNVLVFRRDGARTVRVARLRLGRLQRGEDILDLHVSRFDIVYVPRSSIGNVDVFVRQFFGDLAPGLDLALKGWELFNLDRVYVTRVIKD